MDQSCERLAELLSECIFFDLAHGISRQLSDEEYPFRHLKISQARADLPSRIRFRDPRVRFGDENGDDPFPEIGVGHAEYG